MNSVRTNKTSVSCLTAGYASAWYIPNTYPFQYLIRLIALRSWAITELKEGANANI